jgi:hypothetical protein
MMKRAVARKVDAAAEEAVASTAAPRLPAVGLGTLVAREGDRWRVRVAGAEHPLAVDAAVDPALLDEALASGARVLVDGAGDGAVVGVVLTARPVAYGRDGALEVAAPRVTVDAGESVVLKTPWAFMQLRQGEAELYGNKVLLRAREVARVLARMIALN